MTFDGYQPAWLHGQVPGAETPHKMCSCSSNQPERHLFCFNPMLDISASANLGHYLVHGPAIEVLVREDFKRDPVLVSVSLHSFQGVVSVACD